MSSSSSAGIENEILTVSKQPIVAQGKEGQVLLWAVFQGQVLHLCCFTKGFSKQAKIAADDERNRKILVKYFPLNIIKEMG